MSLLHERNEPLSYALKTRPGQPVAAVAQSRTWRFTVDGGEALESKLLQICEEVVAAVRRSVSGRRLEAVVLAGGYGRGEGGVLQESAGEEAYNDLDFYVFLRGNGMLNQFRHGSQLHTLGREISDNLSLDVELKLDSVKALRRRAVSMFSYDLIARHRLLFGDHQVFDGCEKHGKAENIPSSEATRLLLNRCSGLLLVKEILFKQLPGSQAGIDAENVARSLTLQQTDFIRRNLEKLKLALGDAFLAALGQYHWSCLVRRSRLEHYAPTYGLPWLSVVQRLHSTGVEFKLHPYRSAESAEVLAREFHQLSDHALQMWLWLEGRRLNRTFLNAADYALSSTGKAAGRSIWRHYLLNLGLFGLKTCCVGNAFRYPRERLFNTLPLLLWSDQMTGEAAVVRHLRNQLGTDASGWSGLVAAYKRIWLRFG